MQSTNYGKHNTRGMKSQRWLKPKLSSAQENNYDHCAPTEKNKRRVRVQSGAAQELIRSTVKTGAPINIRMIGAADENGDF